ncbi:MAG: glycosyltransferase [Planctomycetota bacterium]
MTATTTQPVGVVAIGRNEGERLRRCLESVVGQAAAVVYVDSGSTDGSVELAGSLGVEVVSLDLSIPFTAARARNEGFARLQQLLPDVEYVQMIDGDCEVVVGWLDAAVAALTEDEKLAVVCGRRRERFPDATIYNRLTDMEWDTPIGIVRSCGGDALFRAAAMREVEGYNPAVIAGEEPEMCVRLRGAGWTIRRLDAEMTLHDAAMTRFGQWWKRNVRAGYAYAQGTALHGKPPERHNYKQVRSIFFWGLTLPVVVAVMALLSVWVSGLVLSVTAGFVLVAPLLYPLLAFRIWRYRVRRGDASRHALAYAVFTVFGKFANLWGVLKFIRNRLLRKQARIIEYKTAERVTA